MDWDIGVRALAIGARRIGVCARIKSDAMSAIKKKKARYTGFKREFGQVKMDGLDLKDPSVQISCGEPDPRTWHFCADGRWYMVNIQEYLDGVVFPELAELIRKAAG